MTDTWKAMEAVIYEKANIAEAMIFDGMWEYLQHVEEEEWDEEMAEVDARWAREAQAERQYEEYLVDLKHKRSVRRAELEKRKAQWKKRRSELDYYHDEDGNQIWYLYEPDARIVGLRATTPSPCGKWCVCRDRGKNYNREAFRKNTRKEMEY